MIWLTWRQLRTQALVAGIVLAALAAYLLYLGVQIRADYRTDVLDCVPSDCTVTRRLFGNAYEAPIAIISLILIAVPGLIGAFWGAPLVARELENRTDRLVWNQSVTRGRWLAVKLTVLGVAAVAVTGLYSLLLTWSASRYDEYVGSRFSAPNFGARGVAPLGYAAFAFVFGVVVGLVVRRTVASMAIVVALYTALQIVVPLALRAHLMPPVTTEVKVTADVMAHAQGFGMNDTSARILGYTQPGAWSMTPDNQVFMADGTPLTAARNKACQTGSMDGDFACMESKNLHFVYSYQPASRYWPFQWIETSAYLVLAGLLAGFGLWWVRRRIT
ncbi:ABC transporter permease subunit [Dactylosporangium matsuzakiense]|uniref:Transporter n=1 Tax=Dactylosporangium matsuzakiense TaxID=53360 RepID=A0A9W6KX32_9ACTN|nr:ABC transporter permease subunit [Dactylosporangium matsuzakiense]UWZ49104.1 ABC transporter permease subunit [Dactylosporangium matsuzakiense]GLL08000.1 transporter [Dactylosporangium matsuzakiense]